MGILWDSKKETNGNCNETQSSVTIVILIAFFVVTVVNFVSAPLSPKYSKQYATLSTPIPYLAHPIPQPLNRPSQTTKFISISSNSIRLWPNQVSPTGKGTKKNINSNLKRYTREAWSEESHHWQQLTNRKVIHSLNDNSNRHVHSAPISVYVGQPTKTTPTPWNNLPKKNHGSQENSWKLVPTLTPTLNSVYFHPQQTAVTTQQKISKPSLVILPSNKISSVHWGSSGSVPITSGSSWNQASPVVTAFTTTQMPAVSSDGIQVHSFSKGASSLPLSPIRLEVNTKDKAAQALLSTSPASIWYKPIINQYMSSTANPIATATKRIPNPSKLETDTSITFKIWSYLDNELKLHGQKEIPFSVLQGFNISQGEIINLNQIPKPLRNVVTTVIKKEGPSIAKRYGQNHLEDDHHWQKLPAVIHGTQSPHFSTTGAGWPSAPARPENSTLLNYVVWSTTSTTPRPNPFHGIQIPGVTSSDSCEDYHKHFEQFLQQYMRKTTTTSPPFPLSPVLENGNWALVHDFLQKQMTTLSPSSEDSSSLPQSESNIFNNALALQWLLSQMGNRNQIPESPSSTVRPGFSSPSDLTKLKPPNRDPFWAYLNPVFQHLLNKKNKFASLFGNDMPPNELLNTFGLSTLQSLQGGVHNNNRRPFGLGGSNSQLLQNNNNNNKNTALTSFTTGQDDYNYNYDITSSSSLPSFTESQLTNNPYRNDIVKKRKGKRKFKKKKKKAKKKKKGGGWDKGDGWLFDPSKFSFNFNFGFDIYDLLKQKFLALIALKFAPIMLLTFFVIVPYGIISLTPLVFKFFNYIRKLTKKAQDLNNKLRPNSGPSAGGGWIPPGPPPLSYHSMRHGSGTEPQHEIHNHYYYDQNGGGGGWSPDLIGAYANEYPSAVSAGLKLDRVSGLDPNYLADGLSSLPSLLPEPELDTQYNREVMEILMNNKNISLTNLLEKWGLQNLTEYAAPAPEEGTTTWQWANSTLTNDTTGINRAIKRKKRRRKRT